MQVNITKKNLIVLALGFLAGAIVATTGFLIFAKGADAKHKHTPPSFSQSQDYGMRGIGGESNELPDNNSNSKKGTKENKNSKNQETPPKNADDKPVESEDNQ